MTELKWTDAKGDQMRVVVQTENARPRYAAPADVTACLRANPTALTAEQWASILSALPAETQDGISDLLASTPWGTQPQRTTAGEMRKAREAIDGACQYMLGHTYRTEDDGKALVKACVDARSDLVEALQKGADAQAKAIARAENAESESAALRAELAKARAESLRALEQLADDNHALLTLRETIDDFLPHYEPEHEAGDYEAVVRIAGKALTLALATDIDALRAELASAKAERDEATREAQRMATGSAAHRKERDRALADLARAKAVVVAVRTIQPVDCLRRRDCVCVGAHARMLCAALRAHDRAQPANPAPGGEGEERPSCDFCNAPIPEGGEGCPEVCPACIERYPDRDPQAPATLADLERLRADVERIARRVVAGAAVQADRARRPSPGLDVYIVGTPETDLLALAAALSEGGTET